MSRRVSIAALTGDFDMSSNKEFMPVLTAYSAATASPLYQVFQRVTSLEGIVSYRPADGYGENHPTTLTECDLRCRHFRHIVLQRITP